MVVTTNAGLTTSNAFTFTVVPPPSITSLSSTGGAAGSSVTITGSNFGPNLSNRKVTFNGVSAPITSWSDTSIGVTVPSAGTTGNVVVTASGGVTSNGVLFTIQPSITSLFPNSAAVGSTVNIAGSSMGGNIGSVSFNGVNATQIVSWGPTSVTVFVPSGASTGNLVLTSAGGTASNTLNFSVVPAPNISSLSPNSGPVGGTVTITGSNFGANSWSVTFNGQYANINGWSDTSISAVVPSGTTTGNVVVTAAGGVSSNGVPFTVANGLNTGRYLHNATLLNSGRALLAGGVSCTNANSCTYLSSAETFDPGSNVFSNTGSMATARSAPAVLLANGKVLIAGGFTCNASNSCTSLSSAELYDPSAGIFTSAGNMNVSRSGHTMTVMNDGRVLIVGGETCTSATACTALNSAEIFDPSSGLFNLSSGTLSNARFGAAASLLPDGRVLIVGGFDGSNLSAASETYNPTFDFFFNSGNLAVARYHPTATLLNNGKVLVAGGSTCISPGCPVASAELYDESHNAFSSAGTMSSARANHTATLLNNGQVLLAGGYNSCTTTCTSESNVEVYDPAANTFSAAAALSAARAGHSAILLPNGNVSFAGGINQGVTLTSNEAYQPAALTPSGLTSIAISPANRSFIAGATLQLTATGTFSGVSTQVLQSVTWSSSDNTVATVTSDASNHGLAYAVASGTVTVSACTGSICGTTSLRVGPPILVGITISPVNGTVPAGLAQKFGATGAFSDGTSQDVSATVSWTSATTQVATVSSIGLATGLTAGTTTIQAASGSLSSSATLTVQPPVLTSLAVQPTLGGTTVGGTQAFTATGTYTDSSTQNLTSSVTWSSSNTAVATIGAGGLSTGVGNGNATITARLGGATATGRITVAGANTPPTISVSVSPAANANGWNNTNVTVTFTCNAGSAAVVSCPAQQVVSSEGAAQVVSGAVTDANGNTASASITLNIDQSTPALSVTAPAESMVTATTVSVSGTVSDALSGLSSVSCNGTTTPVNAGSFSCNIALSAGVNLIRVRALDAAGNVAASNLHVVSVVPLPGPASLTINPMNVTMLVDDVKSFSATDDQGRLRPDASWSVSDSTIASLAEDGSGTLTGVAAGQVTLTARVSNVTAQQTVNVFAGVTLPIGTASWSVPPATGNNVQQIVQARPVAGAPDFYSIESGSSGTVVRGLTIDGQQLWSTGAPSLRGTPDGHGGILFDDPFGRRIIDLDEQTGAPRWEYDFPPNTQLDFPKIAVGQDGKVYLREGLNVPVPSLGSNTTLRWSLIALDADTGAKSTLYTVPDGSRTLINTCNGGEQKFSTSDSSMSNPHVGPDNSVFVETLIRNQIESSGCGGGSQLQTPGVVLSILQAKAGSTTNAPFQTLTSVLADGRNIFPSLLDLISDGQGGWLAAWAQTGFSDRHVEYHVGHGSTDITLPFQTANNGINEVDIVLGDQGFFATDLLTIAAMDLSGSRKWTWNAPDGVVDLQLVGATDGGGLVAKYNLGSGDTVIRFNPSGGSSLDDWDLNSDGTPNSNQLEYFDLGQFFKVSFAQNLTLTQATPFDWPQSVYPRIVDDCRAKTSIPTRVHRFSDAVVAQAHIQADVNEGIDYWRKKGILIRFPSGPPTVENPCMSGNQCPATIGDPPTPNPQNLSSIQDQDGPLVLPQVSNAFYFWQLTKNYNSRFGQPKGIDIFFISAIAPHDSLTAADALTLVQPYPTFDGKTRGLHMTQPGHPGLLSGQSQLTKGSSYIFYFDISPWGFDPDPASLTNILGGDSNFGTPNVFLLPGGNLAVSFIYQGGGSNIANAGGEMENVFNSGTGGLVSSVTFTGADFGAIPGDWKISNQILYGPDASGVMEHEIGHVLQLPHVKPTSNLMCQTRDFLVFIPVCNSPGSNLTPAQLRAAKAAAEKLVDYDPLP